MYAVLHKIIKCLCNIEYYELKKLPIVLLSCVLNACIEIKFL